MDGRIWLINADGTNKRPAAYYNPRPEQGCSDIVAHEYFTPDGRFIAFIYYPGTWAVNGSLRMRDVVTLQETVIGPCNNYCHMTHSPDSCLVAGDEYNTAHPEKASIWLYNLSTREERRLCRHSSSYVYSQKCRMNRDTGRPSFQDSHPHVAFLPDSRHVVFTSDKDTSPSGNCAVYLVDTEGVF